MLVLIRKPYKESVIRRGSDEIVISVLNSCGRPVRLGIDAPEDYEILRAELLEKE